jgi:hypothetical protein
MGSYNRSVIKDKMRRADALLKSIKALMRSMNNHDYFKTDAEYQKLKQVKARVMADGKREWMCNAPWDED